MTALTGDKRAISELASYLTRTFPTMKEKTQICMLTDALGLATKDAFSPYKYGFWGHSSSYNQRGMNDAMKETWATYGGCIMSNDKEQRGVLDEIMPETMKFMDGLFEIVVDKCR